MLRAIDPIDRLDDFPTRWHLCGDPVGASESQATSRAVIRPVARFPLEGLTPGQLARHRRNCVILAALAAGAPARWVGEAFGLSHSRVVEIRAEYRAKYGGPPCSDSGDAPASP